MKRRRDATEVQRLPMPEFMTAWAFCLPGFCGQDVTERGADGTDAEVYPRHVCSSGADRETGRNRRHYLLWAEIVNITSSIKQQTTPKDSKTIQPRFPVASRTPRLPVFDWLMTRASSRLQRASATGCSRFDNS